MTPLAELLQQGSAHAWLFVPSAILLGALHGLEPGHSKTMMAAFIIAVRGTVTQAILLGLSATVSHTAIVWLVAMAGLYFGGAWTNGLVEPYLQLASGIIIIAVALWMARRTWRDRHHAEQDHAHDHSHHHDHGPEVRRIDTGHGVFMLEVFEDGVPPRWRLLSVDGATLDADRMSVETERPDGARQRFAFADKGAYLESIEQIAEPHEFVARLSIGHGDHTHDYDVVFVEHSHADDPIHRQSRGLEVVAGGYQDAHELAHANDIRRRFSSGTVTTPQIVLFGLTGGLIPCPAAITVLLLCLQLKQVTLGAALVLCFSIGLAATMVATGVIAALAVRHVSAQWAGFGDIARRAPYISAVLITIVGLYMLFEAWTALHATI